ncbi:MAG: hypothetical protein C0483_19835 [Pirellula sp.]|nr:hypothetical protein [Pirellula sp.]
MIHHKTTDETPDDNDTHEGKFVRIAGGKIVTKFEGVEHTHRMAADAKVTRDGKPYKIEDLKRGNQLRITTRKHNKALAVEIECIQGAGIGPTQGTI